MNPRFPVYILSKGRWESRLTAKVLEHMGVPYSIVVEEQEAEEYAKVCAGKILILDKRYQEEYDPCCELEPGQSKGSGPARNFIWDQAIQQGAEWHWIMDDNILSFRRLNRNRKSYCGDGTLFRIMEDFALRYENIAMVGPHYTYFIHRKKKNPPAYINCRLFSCILIRNDIPFRWRARYNEDVDLSLRVLKAGWCTVQFNAFLQEKIATQLMRGGNTDELYKYGTTEKSEMIARLHPDVARVARRFNRIHHVVNYNQFKKNKLVFKRDTIVSEGKNEYGMKMQKIEPKT